MSSSPQGHLSARMRAARATEPLPLPGARSRLRALPLRPWAARRTPQAQSPPRHLPGEPEAPLSRTQGPKVPEATGRAPPRPLVAAAHGGGRERARRRQGRACRNRPLGRPHPAPPAGGPPQPLAKLHPLPAASGSQGPTDTRGLLSSVPSALLLQLLACVHLALCPKSSRL